MTINLYPLIVHEQDLTPDAFGPDIDTYCQDIHDGCKGWGADTSRVIQALGCKDATERYKIALRYKELYGKDLPSLMKKEFSGDFGAAMQFLGLPPDVAECAMLRRATKGVGTNVDIVYSILCGRTNEEVEMIKKTYFKEYTSDLSKLIVSEVSGDLQKLMLNCLQASEQEFDIQYHTLDKAKEDAEAIHKSGQGKFFGTDEKAIFKILCASPPKYLDIMNRVYSDLYGYTLEKALEKELGGNAQTAAIFTLGMKLKPYETIAKLIKTACAGIGTNEMLLATCVIRYQEILRHVMAAHIELFGKTVHDRVREECGGKFRDLMLAILKAAWPEGEAP